MYLKITIAMLFTSASIYSMEKNIQEVSDQWLLVKMRKYVENTKDKQKRDNEVAHLQVKHVKHKQINNQEQQPIARRFGIAHGNSLAKL